MASTDTTMGGEMIHVNRLLIGVRARFLSGFSWATVSVMVWSWIGAFVGIGALAFINCDLLEGTDQVMLIGSFGASAVLVFGAIDSPLAQPRNVIVGHFLSAIVGVATFQLVGDSVPIASAIAVATAIVVMQMTKSVHPPGGATALIAVIGSEKVHHLGFSYAFVPVGCGALVMLLIALVIHNLAKNRPYPNQWW